MSLKKKIIIPVVLAVVIIAGSIGGVVLASDTTTTTTTTATPVDPQDALMTKVATILNIDKTTLEAAFKQAQTEIQSEQLDNQLAKLVSDGKITQDQADAYKAWLAAKPDNTAYQSALKTWMDANPLAGTNVQLPGMGGFGGPGDPGGRGGGPGGPPGGMGGPGPMNMPGTNN